MRFANLWALFLCVSLEATQLIEIDSNALLKCEFSSRHHNRIAVEGQRIKKVFYPEGEILIRVEEETGQLFVQAMIESPSDTTVSIITSEGVVQDLELHFVDRPSEILILRHKYGECCSDFGLVEHDDEITTMQKIIDSQLLGVLPEEYVPVEDRRICCRVKHGVVLKSSMRLVGPFYTVYVLMLENQACKRTCVHEKELNCMNGEWVFLEKSELRSGERALVLIGVKTHEQ